MESGCQFFLWACLAAYHGVLSRVCGRRGAERRCGWLSVGEMDRGGVGRAGARGRREGFFFLRRYRVSFNKTTRIHGHTPHADPARMLQKDQLSRHFAERTP